MSQERTEPYTFTFDESEQLFLRLLHDSLINGLTINQQKAVLADLLTARREEDRLNAVITDLTAKVQERDAVISSMKLTDTLLRDAEKIDLEERDKEIERMREALSVAYEDFNDIQDGERYDWEASKAAKAKIKIEAALKGAE